MSPNCISLGKTGVLRRFSCFGCGYCANLNSGNGVIDNCLHSLKCCELICNCFCWYDLLLQTACLFLFQANTCFLVQVGQENCFFNIIDHNVRLIFYHAHQQAVASEEKMEILNGPESALTFDSFSEKYFSVCKIFFNAFFVWLCQRIIGKSSSLLFDQKWCVFYYMLYH